MANVKSNSTAPLTRRARAKATHWRIVKAAYESFCERGYAGTTMAHVAERAGVAVQTVYFVFHTKSALLSRAIDFAVMGESEPRIPQQQPWWGRMAAEPEITAALRHMVEGVGEMIRRATPLYLIARAGVERDADLAPVESFHEEWRADGYEQMLGVLREKAPLRPGLRPERATQLLLLYVGMDVYHALVDTYRWTHEEWVDWTVATISDQVFGRAGAGRRR
jgi:AcrR family transcriptional regulator